MADYPEKRRIYIRLYIKRMKKMEKDFGFETSKKDRNIHLIGAVLLTLVLIFCWIFQKEADIFPDSATYISMSIHREPGYPLFLAFIRLLVGEGNYLFAVVWFQVVLACYCSISFIREITKQFNVHGLEILLLYVLLLIFWFLPKFFGGGNPTAYPFTILTEGITYSIFFLYYKYLVMSVCNRDKKFWIISLLFAALLSFIRTGLMFTIVATFIVGICVVFCGCGIVKRIVSAGLLVICSFLILYLAEHFSFFSLTGRWMSHTYGPVTAMSNVLYVADKEDSALFENADLKAIFMETYNVMEEEGWRYVDLDSSDIVRRGEHIAACHDLIKFSSFDFVVNNYLEEKHVYQIDAQIEKDRIAGELCKTLFVKHYKRWLDVYISLAYQGFIRSVAGSPRQKIMRIYSFLVALMFFVGVLYYRRNRKMLGLALVTAMLIVGNISSTSLVIMCLNRYMMYNIPIFYSTIIVMWLCRKELEN